MRGESNQVHVLLFDLHRAPVVMSCTQGAHSATTTDPFSSNVTGFRVRAHLQRDPKGGELCSAMVKSWETVMEASRITDVQIVCPS